MIEGDKLKIAETTAAEVSRIATLEIEVNVTADGGKGVKEAVNRFLPRLKSAVESALYYGETAIKPYYNGRFGVEIIPNGRFKVEKSFPDGTPAETVFVSEFCDGTKRMKRIERHIIADDGYIVENTLYADGVKTELYKCQKTKNLCPKVKIAGLKQPLFAILKTEDGESVFNRGREIITEINRQFERLLWEYEGGELAVDVSEDAFRIGRDGKPELPKTKERLFRTNMLDACSSQSELIKTFNPELRDESYIRGLNRLYVQYEDAVGLSRGTFSDVNLEAKTATEIIYSQRRTFCLVGALRERIITALSGLLYALCVLDVIYYGGDGKCVLDVRFGDGINDGGTERKKNVDVYGGEND